MATRATWAERIARWERSGLSRAVFARREGVKVSALSWWRWELGRKAASPVAAFVPSLSFVEVRAVPAPALPVERFEVALGNGRVVLVPQGFSGWCPAASCWCGSARR